MGQDFGSAAGRHLADSDHLVGLSSFDNASHLAGVAAECALKEMLIYHLGGRATAGRPRTPSDAEVGHLPQAWTLVAALPGLRGYVGLATLLSATNPFAKWTVSSRYSATGDTSEADARVHVEAARRLYQAYVGAKISGLLS